MCTRVKVTGAGRCFDVGARVSVFPSLPEWCTEVRSAIPFPPKVNRRRAMAITSIIFFIHRRTLGPGDRLVVSYHQEVYNGSHFHTILQPHTKTCT